MQIKTEEELKVLRYANQVASTAHVEVIATPSSNQDLCRQVHPGLLIELQGMSTSWKHALKSNVVEGALAFQIDRC